MTTIHKEGYRILAGLTVMLLIFNVAVRQLVSSEDVILFSTILSVALFLFTAYFFRNPKRYIVADDNIVISPCDGKVVAIEEVYEPEYFKDKRLQVSIFMSPTNVHVNWTPISGEVKYTKYHPGKYLVAWHPKSSVKNERTSVVIEDDNGFEVLVRQIAGVLARRIVNYCEEGDEIEQGKQLGFIKFGSRIDLFLPLNTKLEVDLKQKVKGGKTVIARLD
ncbi:MAG TPA: phosphatidylserine decarboxylase family protein [Chitinophagales bacterium]|nr:phosphatidylserine decarboxylase family protein [Chitinophagales bacterium]